MVELVLVLGLALGIFIVTRMTEQFRLSFRGGKLLVVRGQLPQGLLNDFADTLRRSGAQSATLVGRRSERGLRLTAGGVSEWDLQRLRNQLGFHPFARLTASTRGARRTVGTLLGVAWLAWLVSRPDDLY